MRESQRRSLKKTGSLLKKSETISEPANFNDKENTEYSHTSFANLFPDIAEKETRVVTLTDQNDEPVPGTAAAFIEHYCTDPDCDCRNVRIVVLQILSRKVLATISYGWEPIQYYRDWMFGKEQEYILENFKGPALAFLAQQSPDAEGWLKIFSETIEADKDYRDRLIRHYKMVKNRG